MNYETTELYILQAIAKFPPEFGLRAFPGERFTINRGASYISEGKVMLYTYILKDGKSMSFAKGTVEELQREVTA